MRGIEQVTSWLACPVCATGLSTTGGSLRCASGHSFDIARQGYVNLLNGPPPRHADTTEMVAARARFLRAGHFDPLAREVSRRAVGHRIVEVGAGTGYYLRSALELAPEATGLATDISPPAARIAAKAHGSMAAVVADTWAGLPVRPSSVDAVLCIFAPRNPPEFWRVLRPGGLLLIATPGAGHLAKLRGEFGLLDIPDDKLQKLARALSDFSPLATTRVEWQLDLSAADAIDLVMMGPNGFHSQRDRLAAELARPISEHAIVDVSLFRKPVS